ncbi:MAG TPA: hypothetical protein GYA08_19590 [Chloroflexi bacterium]|nr:hypothetical protein [Chloroflexota bacterium]
MSVIDSLSAGFRFLGWRLELLLIPVALDLLLWLAPQFSVVTLAEEAAHWYRELGAVEGVPADAAILTQQVAESIEQFGGSFNLLSALVSTTLLHMPSLLVTGSQSSPLPPIELTTPIEAFVFWVVFSLLGLLIGVVYLDLLARRLPIGGMAAVRGGVLAGRAIAQWLQVIAFVLLVALLLLAIYIPISVALSIVTLVSPALGSLLALGSGALALIIFFYLYFATAGIVMDNLSAPEAIKRSFLLVRAHFFATLGFFALSTLIGLGISLLLIRLASYALWAVTPAILLNAYVGTGLAMALLIFYRTRLLSSEAALVQ